MSHEAGSKPSVGEQILRPRGEVGPADLARALVRLQSEDGTALDDAQLTTIARCFGYRLTALEAPSSVAPEELVSNKDDDRKPPEPGATDGVTTFQPVPFLRPIEAVYFGDVAPPSLAPGVRPRVSQVPIFPRLPLPQAPARWPTEVIGPRLYHAISTHPPVGDIDVPRLIRKLGEGRVLENVVRRPRRRSVTHLRVVLERAVAIAPMWSDGDLIAEWCLRWGPVPHVEVIRASWGTPEWPAPDPRGATIVVTDAQCFSEPAQRAAWAAEGRRRASAGERTVLWVLGASASKWPGWSHVVSDPKPTTNRAVDGEDLERVLILASLAYQVEAYLLRELRLTLRLEDTVIEMEAWRHPELLHGSMSTAAWTVEAFRGFRAKLVAAAHANTWLNVDVLREALECIAKYRFLEDARRPGACVWWSSENVWQAEITSWRTLAKSLPRGHAACVEDFLSQRGWLDSNKRYLAQLQRSAGLPAMRDGLDPDQMRAWMASVRLYEPSESWSKKGGYFFGIAQTLAEKTTAVPLHLCQGGQGLELHPNGELGRDRSPVVAIDGTSEGGTFKIRNRLRPLPPGELLPVDLPGWAERATEGLDEFGRWSVIEIVGVPVRMRWIEPGVFVMGSPKNETNRYDDEGPQHKVTLTEGYWLAETPCTQALWTAVMRENPSKFKGDDRPVEGVSWNDVSQFIAKVNAAHPELGMRLPTEAQWEYAARAGTTQARYGDLGDLDAIAWYRGNANNEPHLVGQKVPNAWGLYDVLGNVLEWCHDGMRTYDSGHAYDPIGDTDQGTFRVLRGGSWNDSARNVRAAYRVDEHPSVRDSVYGFRLSRGHDAPSRGPEGQAGEAAPSRDGRSPSGAGPVRQSETGVAPEVSTEETQRSQTPATGRSASGRLTKQLGWEEGEDQLGAYADVVWLDTQVLFRMRWIEPGTFLMGSPEEEEGRKERERPQHQVTLTQGFWLADAPCTQALYEAVTGTNPSRIKRTERPVQNVSWDDAQAFIQALSVDLPESEAFSLPTEAQWEYACRAGTTTPRYGELDAIAWYADNADDETRPVRQRQPNAWGLYDTLGNVWEWCADRFGPYDSDHAYDPIGPTGGTTGGTYRVLRGGCWSNSAEVVRAAFRLDAPPSFRDVDCGFRLSRGLGAPGPRSGAGRPGPRGTRGQGAGPQASAARTTLQSRITLLTDRAGAGLDIVHRPEWASLIGRDRYGLFAEVETEAFVPVMFRMRWIAPGRFAMGAGEDDSEGLPSERPQHEVTLTKGFWLAETPCTEALWTAVMDINPSHFEGNLERPVENVSFEDIGQFLKAANAQVPGLDLRLPTEAQWEYACRAGMTMPRYGELDDVAWYDDNAKEQTHPVGRKQPNAWGLYDTLGNVWEWCADWYEAYDSGHAYDPIGPAEGSYRVLRGGGWSYSAENVRAAYRHADHPSSRSAYYGFRLSRGPGAPSQASPGGWRPGVRGTRAPGADPVVAEGDDRPRSWWQRLLGRRPKSGS